MKVERRGFRRFGALLAGGGIIVSIVVITAVVGDLQEIRCLWDMLRWHYLIWLLALAILDHGLRYWRWEILLRRVASIDFKRLHALLSFLGGSLLVFTPARVGEIAKSVYARDFFGIPMATSLPIIIAERLNDMLVMSFLAGMGLLLLGETPNLWLAGIVLAVTILIFTVRRPLLEWMARRRVIRLRAGSSLEENLNMAKESYLLLLTPRLLGINLVFGLCAWMVEIIIYFLSLGAVGISMDLQLCILALAVFPLASLAGSLSFLPVGLGVTEGGLAALAVLLYGLAPEAAVFAALLSRVAILGVVVIAGIVALPFLNRIPAMAGKGHMAG